MCVYSVPERVWRVNEVGDEEARRLTMEMDGSGEDRWWEQKPLTKLLLSSNQLTELSEDVQLLSQLKTLEVNNVITNIMFCIVHVFFPFSSNTGFRE